MEFTTSHCSIWEDFSEIETDPLVSLADVICFDTSVSVELENSVARIADYVVLEHPWVMR